MGDAVNFSGTSATLAFSAANPVSGTITGFTGNDAIVISNFAYSAQESVTASNDDDVTLTAPDGSVLDLTMQGADTQDFALHSADGGSATVLTLAGPVLTESLIDDTGPGAVTTDPDLTGTTDTPGTLSFSEGGTLLGTLAASPGQPWHFSPAGLATGAHTITVSQTNATGVTGTASITFTLESATYGAPVVTAALAHDTGVSASDGITANPSLTGTADPDATVIFTQIGFFLGTTTASSTGQWQFTPIGLPDGERNIVATDTNAAGQTGTATVNFTLLTSAAAPRGLSLETVIPDLPGYPDNINRASDGNFWCALVGMRSPAFDLALRMPAFRRRMAQRVAPDEWMYPNMNTGCVIKFAPDGRVLETLWDLGGENHPMITSMREHRGSLYLGGVHNNRIGRYRIPGADPDWTGNRSYWGSAA